MEFLELANKRYSCKSFNGEKVDRDKLQKILEAGRCAPTAKNLQEQHVYVIESEEYLKKIDEATPCRYNASTVLVVTYDKNNMFTYPRKQKYSGVEDISIIATHMMLAATSLDVDSCWINNFDTDKLIEVLNLPDYEEPVLIMDLGYKNDAFKPLPNHYLRKELKDTVTFM